MNSAKRVVIIGATSEIAIAVANVYAEAASRILLVGRNEEVLLNLGKDLKQKGAEHCAIFLADLRSKESHDAIVETAKKELGTVDVVLVAHGIYPDMQLAERDVDVMLDIVMTNAVSAMSIMHRFGNALAQQKSGTIAILSSVAGDRGRRNNYIYGSTKAALTAYASGMRASFAEKGVHVITIKPGPVDTRMTQHKNMPLVAKREKVASSIVDAIESRRKVLYTPWYWRYIMMVIKLLPESVFMKLKM